MCCLNTYSLLSTHRMPVVWSGAAIMQMEGFSFFSLCLFIVIDKTTKLKNEPFERVDIILKPKQMHFMVKKPRAFSFIFQSYLFDLFDLFSCGK